MTEPMFMQLTVSGSLKGVQVFGEIPTWSPNRVGSEKFSISTMSHCVSEMVQDRT